jgi:hypothetical protein
VAFGFQKTKTTKLRSHKKVGLVVFWLITHVVWERESKKGIGKHVKTRYSTTHEIQNDKVESLEKNVREE